MKRKILFTAILASSMFIASHISLQGAPEPMAQKDIKINTEKLTTSTEKKPVAADQKDISGKKETGQPVSFTEEKTSLYSLFRQGGPFMWPILLFFALALGFIIERGLFFYRSSLGTAEFIDDFEKIIADSDFKAIHAFCENRDEAVAAIVAKGLKVRQAGIERIEKSFSVAASVQVAALERGLNVISAMGNIVPMLGFLGTVSGMITAFSKIAAADQVNARLVAGGIQEALLTTAAGLIAAIPALFCYNYFVHRIDVFVAGVERITADIVEKMIEEEI